ncbi:MAG TPA: phosphoribosylamine--glycine ligase [Bacillota bacterium]|nr:phosphoribosylamine--glycine ligase [Bacillota bacterium]
MGETVTLIGGDGRAHAMAQSIMQSGLVDRLCVLPGNPGTQEIPGVQNVRHVNPADPQEVSAWAQATFSNLVVIGPEAPLAAGVADQLRADDIPVFGPNQDAARLESDKAFALNFMGTFDIPHPPGVLAASVDEAQAIIAGRSPQKIVLKLPGLAAGKGVVLPESPEEMRHLLAAMFAGTAFEGVAGDNVIIQDRWHGPEVSAFVVSDGYGWSMIPFMAQDHKRRDEGDTGPNTGGMGAYSPVALTPRQLQKLEEIADRTIEGARATEIPYNGVLYIGAMLAEELDGDPAVIEYNCRFGDPEAQTILPLMVDAGINMHDFYTMTAMGYAPHLRAAQTAGLAALTVCLAAEGYPVSPKKGALVHGAFDQYPDVIVTHAGTQFDENGILRTCSGRALYVTGKGVNVNAAAAAAYAAIGGPDKPGVYVENGHYRRDIGHRVRTR